MIAVADTSALMRLFIPDGPIPEGMESVMRKAETGNASVAVPELALAECAQVLLKKRRQGLLSEKEANPLLNEILALPLKTFGHGELLNRAWELSEEYGNTVYDCLFLTLAEKLGAALFTADGKMEKVAKKLGL